MYEERRFYVYILTNQRNGTLYTGMTNDIARRIHEHRTKAVPGFTRKYGLTLLVWYDVHPTLDSAYMSEKRIKRWRREWKIQMIEKGNPNWQDLTHTLM